MLEALPTKVQWSKWLKFVSLHFWRAPRGAKGVKNPDDQTEVHSSELAR